MNEKSKIYIVFAVIVALVLVVVGYNIELSNKSKKVYEEFTTNFTSENEEIIFIGREGCSWCQLFRPIFDYYSKKYEISYTYIDTDKLVKRDFNKILKDINVSSDDFGTPLVVFTKNGEVVETINGYVDERKLLEIFQGQNLVAESEKVELNYLDFNSLKKVIKGKEKSVIVIGQTRCPYCIRFKPILMDAVDNNGAKIYYMNYDEITEQSEIKEYLSGFEEFQGDWGTPLTIVVQNGKIIATLDGYAESSIFINFLKENKLIKE